MSKEYPIAPPTEPKRPKFKYLSKKEKRTLDDLIRAAEYSCWCGEMPSYGAAFFITYFLGVNLEEEEEICNYIEARIDFYADEASWQRDEQEWRRAQNAKAA